jgi:phage shock protein PspC (stress-responsive transcriptional regulator)
MARDQLTRDPDNALLGGVCAGIGRHYGFDVTVVRIVWLVLTVFSMGTSVILYIAAWVIMPLPDEADAGPAPDRGAQHRSSTPPAGAPMPARERFVESGRVLINHARRSAEEIAEIARGSAAPSSGGPAASDDAAPPEGNEDPPPPGSPA